MGVNTTRCKIYCREARVVDNELWRQEDIPECMSRIRVK